MNGKIWRIIDVISSGTEYFKRKNIEPARLTIELMLSETLSCERVDLYANFERPLDESELSALRNMMLKRASGEPLQYVLGKTNFYGLEILVNDSVLIPRPETETLVEKFLERFSNKYSAIEILEIGTGSGCVALAIAKNLPNAKIEATDNSYFALMTAKNNASNLAIKNVSFIKNDILKEKPSNKKYDAIVSNPPYVPLKEYRSLPEEIRDREPRAALTDGGDGFGFYRRFAQIFKSMLTEKGLFFLEIGYGQKETVQEIFEREGYSVSFEKDLNGIDRVAIGRIP